MYKFARLRWDYAALRTRAKTISLAAESGSAAHPRKIKRPNPTAIQKSKK
jgi:hypothetical protein